MIVAPPAADWPSHTTWPPSSASGSAGRQRLVLELAGDCGDLGSDLIGLRRAEVGVKGEGLLPVMAGPGVRHRRPRNSLRGCAARGETRPARHSPRVVTGLT